MDRNDTKAFYDGLKAVYGTRDSGSVPMRSEDGDMLITDRAGIMSRWAEHFKSVLNQPSQFDSSVLDDIPQWDTEHSLMDPISQTEVQKAIDRMSSRKLPGQDGLLPELFKANGDQLTARL